MIPVDFAVGGDAAGAPPLVVYDADDHQVEDTGSLPRLSLQADFTLPGAIPRVNSLVSLVATEWSGEYSLSVPYQASVVEVGLDFSYRGFPLEEPSETYSGIRVCPYGEIGMGVRALGLFQSWWTDIGRLGWAGHVGLGATIGGKHQHIILGGKYEAVLAGTGVEGVLDSGAQDMTWTWNPSAARLYLLAGVGWR